MADICHRCGSTIVDVPARMFSHPIPSGVCPCALTLQPAPVVPDPEPEPEAPPFPMPRSERAAPKRRR